MPETSSSASPKMGSDNNSSWSRVFGTAKWFLEDAVWRNRTTVTAVVGMEIGGLILEMGAYGFLYLYTTAVEGRPLDIPTSLEIPSDSSGTMLVTVTLAFFSFLMLSLYITYASKRRSLRLAFQHQEFCAKRVAVLTSHLPHPNSPGANQALSGKLLNYLELRDARYCGRCLKLIVEAVRPAGLLIISGVALLYISLVFGVIVLALTTVMMMTLRRVYWAAARSSRNVEDLAGPARKERQDRMSTVMESTLRIDYKNHQLKRDFATGMTRRYLDVLREREWVKERAKLVIDVLTSVSLLAVLFVAAIGLLHGQWSLSTLLLFLVALRYFSGSLMQLGGILTSLSRAYPHLRRYSLFVKDASRAIAPIPSPDPIKAITLEIPSLLGGTNNVVLDPTRTIWLLHPRDSGRNLIRLLMDHTRCGTASAHGLYRIVNERAIAGGNAKADVEALDRLPCVKLREALVHLLPQDCLDAASMAKLDEWRNYCDNERTTPIGSAVAMLAAFLSSRPAILVDSGLEAEFNPGWRARLTEMFGPRVLIKTTGRFPETRVSDTDILLLSDREKLVGWTYWRTAKDDSSVVSRVRRFPGRPEPSLSELEDIEAV